MTGQRQQLHNAIDLLRDFRGIQLWAELLCFHDLDPDYMHNIVNTLDEGDVKEILPLANKLIDAQKEEDKAVKTHLKKRFKTEMRNGELTEA